MYLQVPNQRDKLHYYIAKTCGDVMVSLYLLLWSDGQHPPDEHPVRDEFQPRVREAGSFGGPQNMQSVAECSENLVVDGLKDWFRCVELQKQHDEDSMVGQLLELCKAVVVVLQEHSGNDAQHLFVHTAVHSFSSFAGTLRPRAVTSLPDNAYCLATGITSTGTRRAVAATLLKDNSTLSLNGRSKILWCYTSASTLQLGTGTDTKL